MATQTVTPTAGPDLVEGGTKRTPGGTWSSVSGRRRNPQPDQGNETNPSGATPVISPHFDVGSQLGPLRFPQLLPVPIRHLPRQSLPSLGSQPGSLNEIRNVFGGPARC